MEPNVSYVCKVCEQEFKSIRGFEDHSMMAHGSILPKNENVPLKFKSETAKLYVCNFCLKGFKSINGFQNHTLKAHSSVVVSNTTRKNENIPAKSEVKNHLRTHNIILTARTEVKNHEHQNTKNDSHIRDDTNSKKIESNLMDDDVLKKECLTRRLVIKLKRIGNAQNQSEPLLKKRV